MAELFIGCDPRWLSGGDPSNASIDYSNPPEHAYGTDPVTTKRVFSALNTNDETRARNIDYALAVLDQTVHRGKASYHHRPNLNLFLDNETPTVGVELETQERFDVSITDLERELISNWFHFESDSSLVRNGHKGYELITEPLPPRVYRDIRTWIGLQNLLTPWVESFEHPCTGLHVHVGLEQFKNNDVFGFSRQMDNMAAAKFTAAAVYLTLIDRSFSDSVFLRRNTEYCADNSNGFFTALAGRVTAGELTAGAFIDAVVSMMLTNNVSIWRNYVDSFKSYIATNNLNGFIGTFLHGFTPSQFAGHGVELNCGHSYTIEFRRGKGTLNGISIHRMIEFTTTIVKYVEYLTKNRNEKISPRHFLDYLISTTNSPALMKFAEKAKGN